MASLAPEQSQAPMRGKATRKTERVSMTIISSFNILPAAQQGCQKLTKTV
jgi:hypothetical protein